MAFKQHHKDNWNGNKQHKDGLKMWQPWRILNRQNKLRGGIDPEKPHQATCSLMLLYFTFTRSECKDCHP